MEYRTCFVCFLPVYYSIKHKKTPHECGVKSYQLLCARLAVQDLFLFFCLHDECESSPALAMFSVLPPTACLTCTSQVHKATRRHQARRLIGSYNSHLRLPSPSKEGEKEKRSIRMSAFLGRIFFGSLEFHLLISLCFYFCFLIF